MCSSCVELACHLQRECELQPAQCQETVEFWQLTYGFLNLTLLPNEGDGLLSHCCPIAVPTCWLLVVGGTGPVRESVLEGADLAVRGAGVAVGARGHDGVAAAVQDTKMPEDSCQTPSEVVNCDHLRGLMSPK